MNDYSNFHQNGNALGGVGQTTLSHTPDQIFSHQQVQNHNGHSYALLDADSSTTPQEMTAQKSDEMSVNIPTHSTDIPHVFDDDEDNQHLFSTDMTGHTEEVANDVDDLWDSMFEAEQNIEEDLSQMTENNSVIEQNVEGMVVDERKMEVDTGTMMVLDQHMQADLDDISATIKGFIEAKGVTVDQQVLDEQVLQAANRLKNLGAGEDYDTAKHDAIKDILANLKDSDGNAIEFTQEEIEAITNLVSEKLDLFLGKHFDFSPAQRELSRSKEDLHERDDFREVDHHHKATSEKKTERHSSETVVSQQTHSTSVSASNPKFTQAIIKQIFENIQNKIKQDQKEEKVEKEKDEKADSIRQQNLKDDIKKDEIKLSDLKAEIVKSSGKTVAFLEIFYTRTMHNGKLTDVKQKRELLHNRVEILSSRAK